MDYMVGDVQGCAKALERLLEEIGFSPSRDHLYVLGDLVNRGPDSLGTLRRLRGLGAAATCLLGNHDWHLLAVAAGVRPAHRSDTLDDILEAPDREAWLEWLRQRRMAVHAHGWLMLHAGVAPQWDLPQTLSLAAALERQLRTAPPREFLQAMFGNEPARWSDTLKGDARLRFTLNALTRIRFVDAAGTLDFAAKDGIDAAPQDGRDADRLRPLVDARPDRPACPARPRHRLRLGWHAECRAHRRRATRAVPDPLRPGATPWLTSRILPPGACVASTRRQAVPLPSRAAFA